MAEAAAQQAAKRHFRSRGTSSTATRARSRGGCTRAGPFEAIVCVTRGGLVPAAIVARELEVRLIETVCVASYHDYQTQGARERAEGRGRTRSRARRRRRARAC